MARDAAGAAGWVGPQLHQTPETSNKDPTPGAGQPDNNSLLDKIQELLATSSLGIGAPVAGPAEVAAMLELEKEKQQAAAAAAKRAMQRADKEAEKASEKAAEAAEKKKQQEEEKAAAKAAAKAEDDKYKEMAQQLVGKHVKIPAASCPGEEPPEVRVLPLHSSALCYVCLICLRSLQVGYWKAKVINSVDKFRNTWVKPEGEAKFYRDTAEVASWEIIA